MPLLAQFCQGVPGVIRQTAELVTSSCTSLWDLLEIVKNRRSEVRKAVQDRILQLQPNGMMPSRTSQERLRRRRITGPWQMGEVKGQGAQGVVHHALDLTSGFAVKIVSDSPELRQELGMYQQLQHDHIVSYLGHEVHNHQLYIFLEFMPRGTLRQQLSEFGAFQESFCAGLSQQILSGLAYLHDQRVIHRDLKCSNILVDFGCSREISAGSQAKTFRGSPLWLAPELLCAEKYDLSADIWSFGCTVLELLTAELPWHGEIAAETAFQAAIQIQQRTARGESPGASVAAGPISKECKDFVWASCLQRLPANRKSAAALLAHPWLLPGT
eukprot:CAMPEP_0206491422 /NCGR_PEP_ID=MMETSP0324_2-20121206/44987_1 /ASSEMBLY_ACC=CAM_ASM_000836 /TAXON_ID=2866 /ORGANISM="Crypthecodinium cohnii, Strain Seligo" /LENGTH=327 /DNA_ID=CAMNT_0053972611 /DNA_START=127 /DNA_END=1110 /DNA_ORIENTATION=+